MVSISHEILHDFSTSHLIRPTKLCNGLQQNCKDQQILLFWAHLPHVLLLFFQKRSQQSHRLCPDCGTQTALEKEKEKGAHLSLAVLCSLVGQRGVISAAAARAQGRNLSSSHRGTAQLACTNTTPWPCKLSSAFTSAKISVSLQRCQQIQDSHGRMIKMKLLGIAKL